MADRYFVETPIIGPRCSVAGPEAHHLLHVLRGKVGDEVTLFDGSGREFTARIAGVSRREAECEVLTARDIDRELAREVVLAVAWPKGERQAWLIEKAVELGVRRLVPLVTARGVAEVTAAALARGQRAVVEASKQCGRNRLMEIAEPVAWREFLTGAGGAAGARWVAHPGAAARLPLKPPQGSVVLAVGPEGGLTDEECQAARQAGWELVSLGARVLRVETAAVALAAWGALGDGD